MSLQRDIYARDACAINERFIENTLNVAGASYVTLTAKGREPATFNYETNTFDQKKITIEYALQCSNSEVFRKAFDRLMYLLSYRRDVTISFNDEFDKFYIGNIEVNELTQKHGTWAIGSYTIVCKYPFKYSKTLHKIEGTVVNAGKQEFTIPNYEGTYPASPIFIVEPGANDSFPLYTNSGDSLTAITIQQASDVSMYSLTKGAVISIGNTSYGSYDYGSSSLQFAPNMKYITSNTFFQGWYGDTSKCAIGTFNDANYNQGEGLSYKAVYSTDLDDAVDDLLYLGPKITRTVNSMTNFTLNGLLRVYCETSLDMGGIGLFASTSDDKITGVLVYKDSVFDYSATVYYVIDSTIVGYDNVFLDKFNDNFGLTQRNNSSFSYGFTQYYSPITNEELPESTIVESTISEGGGYNYSKPNNNVYISKFDDEYTFKVGNLETRRFVYRRNSTIDLQHNGIIIGFKGAVGGNYVNMHLADISLCSYQNPNFLRNGITLLPGQKYVLDHNNNKIEKGFQTTCGTVNGAELINFNNSENQFYITKITPPITAEYYDVSNSWQHPKLTMVYNDVYI